VSNLLDLPTERPVNSEDLVAAVALAGLATERLKNLRERISNIAKGILGLSLKGGRASISESKGCHSVNTTTTGGSVNSALENVANNVARVIDRTTLFQ
jgi:hypothetical protein